MENLVPINRDLSDVPAAPVAAGNPPHKEAQTFLAALAEQWYQEYLDSGADDRAFAVEGRRFRASWAGGCARSLAYKIAHEDARRAVKVAVVERENGGTLSAQGMEELQARVAHFAPTNPPSMADLWRMSLGTKVHELFDNAIRAKFPTAHVEVAVDLASIEVDGAATVDVVIVLPVSDVPQDLLFRIFPAGEELAPDRSVTILLELKTSGGFAFKLSTISFKGPAQGPKLGHQLQVGLAGKSLGADAIIIGYLSMENISHDIAKRNELSDVERFLAGWVMPREEFEPLVDREIKRINRVIGLLDGGELAPRKIFDGEVPPRAEVENVDNGYWTVRDDDGAITDSGTTWWCDYCWSRDRCREDGPGVVPIQIRTKA